MKKLFLFLIVALTFSLTTKAQKGSSESNYSDAIGIRLGSTAPVIQNGISYKHFLQNNKAVEGILSFGDGVGICGLYEIHNPINSVQNLQWFYGFGAFLGFNSNITKAGGAGVVGLDYKFTQVPLNLSLDWKPELSVVPSVGFQGNAIGLSARFVIK